MGSPLRVRWLGRVPYHEALIVQRALFSEGREQHLLLLEHPHVFTYGRGADLANNLLVDPGSVGAELVAVNRGGDITYHGPGQLVGYPILNVGPASGGGPADTVAYVTAVEQLVIDAVTELGADRVGRLAGFPGVWIDPEGASPRKVCAIGVRLSRGRTMHGFALNVTTDMAYLRRHIVPCGISGKAVTSLEEEGLSTSMDDVVDVIARLASQRWGGGRSDRQDVVCEQRPSDLSAFSRGEGPGEPVRTPTGTSSRMLGRLAQAGVEGGLSISRPKPEWMRPRVRLGPEVLELRKTLGRHELVTVCQEAGCPNLSECWAQGTATFMVLGDRCTRACGFCLVDTRRPEPPRTDEPDRVARAVADMGLAHAVLTMVARDDLEDGGMAHVAACVEAIRRARPETTVETLVSDVKGDESALAVLFDVRPDVFNHNLETVARLQRAVRPSAGYARSLAVLARAKANGLVTKSGLMVGLGETPDEVEGCLADLAGIGVDIVTIGQYLRPTTHHLPVARWAHPDEFTSWASVGRALGIGHVEASPLTRSSYHAHEAAQRITKVSVR